MLYNPGCIRFQEEQYLLSSSHYNKAGQLIWHAGEDGKRTVYTYTSRWTGCYRYHTKPAYFFLAI